MLVAQKSQLETTDLGPAVLQKMATALYNMSHCLCFHSSQFQGWSYCRREKPTPAAVLLATEFPVNNQSNNNNKKNWEIRQ